MIVDMDKLYIPQPKQLEAFRCIGKYSRILYGGARGGAKTSFAVWAAMQCCLQYPGLRVGIVRENYKELREQIVEKELLGHYPEELGIYRYAKSTKTAHFNNGSMIYFISLHKPSDIKNEQGIERGLYILDEGNHLTWNTIKKLEGSNRTGSGIVNEYGEPWKDTMIITANPGGICDHEIKYRWIYPDYTRWTAGELKLKDEYIFIKSNVYDNKHLKQSYIDNLEAQADHLRKQWLFGDWNVNSGAFFDEWNPDVHVVDTLPTLETKPPKEWAKWRCVDMGGGTHPSVCLWLCQDPNTGIIYCYNEYASLEVTDTFADAILKESEGENYMPGQGDPAMWTKNHDYENDESPQYMFERKGIFLEKANNERVNGWRNMKQWLHWKDGVEPKLKILKKCWKTIETIPLLQFVGEDKPDLNTRAQDDFADALRYGLTPTKFGYVYSAMGELVQMPDHPPILTRADIDKNKQRDSMQLERADRLTSNLSERQYWIPGLEGKDKVQTSIYSIF